MRRSFRRAFAIGLALSAVAGPAANARAQYGYGSYPSGYGSYGWGGWNGGGGATAYGDMARGLGAYNAGAGVYNEKTAVANSIDTDTVMRWNEFMYLSQVEANRNEYRRLAARQKHDIAAYDTIHKRIHDNPSEDDIASGNALNAALEQLSNPKIHSSALRQANIKIPGKVIREIPFVNASEAVAISLNTLTSQDGWPAALHDAKFTEDRKAYTAAVQKALKEDADGEIAPETIQAARLSLSKIRAKLEAAPPTDRAAFGEAEMHLKALTGMTKMLDRPDVDKVLAELNGIKETTLGSLLGFMHTFNLRFGPATNPSQRAAYAALFPLVDEQRDKIVASLNPDPKKPAAPAPAADDKAPPTDFFKGLNYDHLEGTRRDGTPTDNK